MHAHRHLDLLPLSSFVGLGGLLIRLCFCFGLAVLLLGPSSTYLLFYKGSRLWPAGAMDLAAAASGTGANQWHSLLDSLERP